MTVIHELGHTATSWLLAGPAVPSFDFTYGGGLSPMLPRQPILVALIFGWFALTCYRARDDRAELIRWTIGAAAYGAVLFTPLRELLILAMGHGLELLIAGVFLYRAVSGKQLLRDEERPLYAALGLYIIAYDLRFGVNLIKSEEFREAYGDAKGGGHIGDFDRIAAQLGWSIQGVARLFLIPCALTPVASFSAHRYRRK